MEKIEKYKSIARHIVNDLGEKFKTSEIETQVIIDEKNGHYMIFNNGWRDGKHRIYGCIVHIEVKENEKVWLHHDGTDLIIGQQILDAGVPKNKLVIGFHSPSMRKDTEFAEA
jgi:hypothetical protein